MELELIPGWQKVLTFVDTQGSMLIIFLLFFSLMLLIIWFLEHRANKKYRSQHLTLLEGIHIANVEEYILKQNEEIKRLQDEIIALQRELKIFEQIQQLAIQRVGLVRYNPFLDLGGDQSFSIALLDGREDGLVITSIYGREESRLFAKPIKRGQTRYRLTDEELLAIDRAKNDQNMESFMTKGGGEELP